MPLTRAKSDSIDSGAITSDKIAAGAVTAAKVAEGVGGGPKITNIQVTNNSYTVLDDTAVDLSGGYVKLTGTGFAAGCQVMINNTPATSTTFVSSTEVRAQVPAQSAGSYVVYLVNSDGGVAIRINGITYSASPVWVTGSTLSTQQQDVAISIQLSATGASTYALAAGSTLPTGVTLSAGGLLSGTVTGLGAATTYSFTVNAIDTENQDSPRTFSLPVSIIIPDPYFAYTTLLVRDNGSNTAQNNTFVDSSTNAFTITRNGNATQGTFSPFSPTGWSAYYDSTSTRWSGTLWYDLSQQTFTVEFWMWPTAAGGGWGGMIFGNNQSGAADSSWIVFTNERKVGLTTAGTSNVTYFVSTAAIPLNTWTHVAITISGASGSATGKIYLNGVLDATATNMNTNIANVSDTITGSRGDRAEYNYYGYISNLRAVKGQVLYTGNFTPPTAKLTTSSVGTSGANVAASITGTVTILLFADNNLSNRGSITAAPTSNSARVDAFSAVTPAEAWSAATHGGSAYFDGSGDFLSVNNDASLQLVAGTPFCIEAWVYPESSNLSTDNGIIGKRAGGNEWQFNIHNSFGGINFWNGSTTYQGNFTMTSFEWQHVAVTWDGTTMRFFRNGVMGTTHTGVSFASPSTNQVNIGALVSNGAAPFTGKISGLRLVKGSAVYTSAFTPPTAPVTAIANTSLLLNSTNTGIYDATARNVIETIGDAKVSTAVKKYGTGSMSFDGTGDYLLVGSTSSNPSLTLAGNFTVEGWFNITGVPAASYYCIFSYGSTGSTLRLFLYSTQIRVFVGASQNIDVAAGTVNATWRHFALVRNGSTVTLYLDGSSVGSFSDSTTYTGTLTIGGETTSHPWVGYIDDLRITRGVARYTANFTAPDREFTAQ